MGLLDGMNDPMMGMAMGLLNASGPSRTPVSLGQAIAHGYGGLQEAQDRNQSRLMMQMKLDKMKQMMEDQNAVRSFDVSKFYKTPQQQSLEANAGQPGFNPPSPSGFQPKFDQKAMIGAMMESRNPALMQQGMQMLTKEDAPIVLKEGETAFNKGGTKLFGNPKDPMSDLPAAVKEYNFAKSQGYKGTFQQFMIEQKQAGANNISLKVGNSFGEGVAKAGAERLMTQVESAASAPQTVEAANQVLSALDTGKVIAGPGTKYAIAAKQMFGGDQEKLNATRAAIQGMAKLILQGRQSLKGQGQITEKIGRAHV